nr:amidohydrolase family protein [Mycolicibacterium insubricum]
MWPRHPDRFVGVAAVDLRQPVAALRELRRAADLGVVALRIVPWLWNLPPDDRRYYPLYAECVELGLPFCTQIGHTGPLCPSEPGRPIPYLDTVLLEFPDLVVVGGHVGYPWINEVISLADKYPNFYVDTSAYAVHRLPTALVEYMRGRGRTRVLFGTNWPMLAPARCLERLDEMNFDAETQSLFLGGNAARIFGIQGAPAADPSRSSRSI